MTAATHPRTVLATRPGARPIGDRTLTRCAVCVAQPYAIWESMAGVTFYASEAAARQAWGRGRG